MRKIHVLRKNRYFLIFLAHTIDNMNKMYYNGITKVKEVEKMAISMRVSEQELELIKTFANINGMNTSEFIRSIVMERIETEFDLQSYITAMKEFEENPKTFSLKEVVKSYGEKV